MVKLQWRVLGLAGYRHGLRHPCLLLELSVEGTLQAELLDSLTKRFCIPMPETIEAGEKAPAGPNTVTLLATLVGEMLMRLQREAGLPELRPHRPLVLASQDGRAHLFVTTLQRAQVRLLQVIKAFVPALNAGLNGEDHAWEELTQSWLRLLIPAAYANSNTRPFLEAAYELDIPVLELPREVLQFGWGKKSFWLDGSFTGETSSIGARLARDKEATNSLLRQCRIPVPEQKDVSCLDEALAAAQQLGYPVVIKPADRDGGIGVAAGLDSPDAVRQAFESAKMSSDNILIERHYPWRDYRLTVFRGETLWAVERIPGGVVGNGLQSISELVDALNRDPRRGNTPHSPLKPIALDDEALALLASAGLTPESIPADGEFVRLRRQANIATGGFPREVFSEAHPDNLALASRAARMLRIDLAGVDLLMPDIKKSWKETGAVICEVNVQPQIGLLTARHVYLQILRRAVSGNGRIPIIVIVGPASQSHMARWVATEMTKAGLNAGWHDADGIGIAGHYIETGDIDPYSGAQALLLDQSVEAVVIFIRDQRLTWTGLPFDVFDSMILIESESQPACSDQAVGQLLVQLLPACTGRVIVSAAVPVAPSTYEPYQSLTRATWVYTSITGRRLARSLVVEFIRQFSGGDESHQVMAS